MKSVSTRLDTETVQDVRETAEARDVSMAEVLRELVQKGLDYDDVVTENERLRRRVQTLIEQREEHSDLVEYVEAERELQRQERERRNANAIERAKWWVFGRE